MTKSQTGCLHDYQLTPQDLKTLENADILIINGAGMESFLDDIISQYPNLEIIDASSGLNLLEDDIHSHDDDHDDMIMTTTTITMLMLMMTTTTIMNTMLIYG